MDGASTFGLWLKQRRKAHDLTQEQLAEQVGCAAETIRKFEADGRRPSRDMADRLADVLGVPVAERATFLRWAREKAAPTTLPEIPQQALVPLLATKLAVPRLHAHVVGRERLLARLDAGLAGRLTVIAAPPGFGKTTLLATWLASRAPDQNMANTLHCAWFALDEGDNDPLLFVRYLIAALQSIAPKVGTRVLRLLGAGDETTIAAALPMLINDLALLPPQSIVVLDDYHVIETPAIHDILNLLVQRAPPHFHLLIASRADPPLPLPRLRVRQEITELRAADLRFTPDEVARFVEDSMRVSLPPSAIATLEARTEGWVAGLQLAALSLQGQPAEHNIARIEAFSGNHHFVGDYLADEVLARLSSHIQAFLLQTSILDRLCGSLCDAVLGQELHDQYIDSQSLLVEIEHKNLFLIALDDERRWYRYHQLFADMLRERLQRNTAQPEIGQLHHRAGRWFERNGFFTEAMRHAVAAQDWELAVQLVERAGDATVLGRMQQHQILRSWLRALPEQVVCSRPKLCLLHARLALLTDVAQASKWAQRAEQSLQIANSPKDSATNIRGEIAALRAGLAASQGMAAEAIHHAQQALADLDIEHIGVRGEVMAYLGRAYLAQHEPARAAEAFAEMGRLARLGGDDIGVFVPETNLAYVQRLQGQLFLANQTCQRALDHVAQRGVDMAADAAWALAARADLLRECNHLDAALTCAQNAATRAQQLAVPNLALLCALVLARVHLARGEVAQALETFKNMQTTVEQFRVVALHPILQAFQAQLCVQSGDFAAATALVGEQTNPSLAPYWISPILVVYGYEHLAIAPAQVLLTHGRAAANSQQIHQAHDLLDPLLRYAKSERLPWLQTKVLALQALASAELDDMPRALAQLGETVDLAAAGGFVRVILDEGAPMIALLAQLASTATPPTASRAAALLAAFELHNHE